MSRLAVNGKKYLKLPETIVKPNYFSKAGHRIMVLDHTRNSHVE